MLGDGVCDDACNTRNCASDNRDCGVAPVFVSPSGSDTAVGTEAAPVRTLERAVTMACTGFTLCLPVYLQAGQHVCSADSAAIISLQDVQLTIQATANAATPPVILCSAQASHKAFNLLTATLTLRHVELRSHVVADKFSVVTLDTVALGDGGKLDIVSSFLRGSHVTAAMGRVVVEPQFATHASFREQAQLHGWLCPGCQLYSEQADLVVLNDLWLARMHYGAAVSGIGGYIYAASLPFADGGAVAATEVITASLQLHKLHMTGLVNATKNPVSLAQCTLHAPITVTTTSFATDTSVVANKVLVVVSDGTLQLHGSIKAGYGAAGLQLDAAGDYIYGSSSSTSEPGTLTAIGRQVSFRNALFTPSIQSAKDANRPGDTWSIYTASVLSV